jgi:hypothetical protein
MTSAVFHVLVWALASTQPGAVEPSVNLLLDPSATPIAAIDLTAIDLTVKPIRKLHLVRPDLIAYPINYAIYC